MSSGEALKVDLANSLRAALPPPAVILNIYGCTEVAADATCYEVPWKQRQGSAEQQSKIEYAQAGQQTLRAAPLAR